MGTIYLMGKYDGYCETLENMAVSTRVSPRIHGLATMSSGSVTHGPEFPTNANGEVQSGDVLHPVELQLPGSHSWAYQIYI